VGATPAGVYSSGIGAIADIVGGSIATSGQQNHALYSDGGEIYVRNMDVSASGLDSAAIYLSNIVIPGPGLVEVTGGSLSSLDAPLILAEGGVGEVILNGPIDLSPATIAGRD